MTNNMLERIPQRVGVKLVFILLFVALLLQIVALVLEFKPDFAHIGYIALGYLTYFYTTLMYLIFSVLLYLEIRNLEEFHMDRFTIATLVLGSFIRRRLMIPGEGIFLFLIGLSGISVILTLIFKKPSIPKTKRGSVLVGIAVSGMTIIVISLVEIFFRNTWTIMPLFRNNILATVIGEFGKELSFGALIEEILFRGFLWGYLRRTGWNDNNIFWTQGILFWLLHISRIVTPFSFFIVIPLITLILSKLVLHSKQIFPAIVSHIIVNITSAMLNLASY